MSYGICVLEFYFSSGQQLGLKKGRYCLFLLETDGTNPEFFVIQIERLYETHWIGV